MKAYDIALNLFDNADTAADPDYRMDAQEAAALLREFRCEIEDEDALAEYDAIDPNDVASEFNDLAEKWIELNSEEERDE